MFKWINECEEKITFYDIDIIKKEDLNYEHIAIINLILIDAFLTLITKIKNNNLMIVDAYKYNKNEFDVIDRIYKFYNNSSFKNLILLNYNCLLNCCLQTRQKVKQLISFFNIDLDCVDKIINKVKNYSKKCNNFFCYLYLYNIFD